MFTVRKVAYLQTKSGAMSITFRIATPTSKLLLKTLESSTFHGLGPSPTPHAVASPGFTPVASGSSSYRFSSRSSQRYDQRVASSDIPVLGGRPRSRESLQTASPRRPSSQRRSTSRRSLSPRRTPSPAQRRSASRRTPSPAKR